MFLLLNESRIGDKATITARFAHNGNVCASVTLRECDAFQLRTVILTIVKELYDGNNVVKFDENCLEIRDV